MTNGSITDRYTLYTLIVRVLHALYWKVEHENKENKYGNNSIYHWKSTVYGNKNTISHNGSTIVPTFVLHLIINELVILHRKVKGVEKGLKRYLKKVGK